MNGLSRYAHRKAVGVDRQTTATHYVVTIHLDCGHDYVERFPVGYNMHGRRDDSGSLNRRKADRVAWSGKLGRSFPCLACGPSR